MNECFDYFVRSFSSVHPKVFNIPSWIPTLSDSQISNVIRKMKASVCPCPLDQLSIIFFKRCPFLRTYLSEIIRTAWSTGSVPSEWKRACTILIHKKENANNHANFPPITLQSVPLKVFTSRLRDAIFNFLSANNYIEQEIQKGFTPGLSGTFEHNAQMANIINKARTKQRTLVITLLDLKNALKTSILTNEFRTPFISVGHGVLQGDCLSPLLFKLCFNTFLQHIKSEKVPSIWLFPQVLKSHPLVPVR